MNVRLTTLAALLLMLASSRQVTSNVPSVLNEFRHVTIGLEMTSALLRGEEFDFVARGKADATEPKTRDSVVAEMEAAIAVSCPLVETSPKPLLIGWIDHQAEHYGKLVSNYRSVGIVPPISRKAGSQ